MLQSLALGWFTGIAPDLRNGLTRAESRTARSQRLPRHIEHPVDCDRSSPLPNTKETLLCLDTTSLLVVKTPGGAYHERNVFCCREAMLLVCTAAAENPPASTWGTVPKPSAHGLGWWARRDAHLNLLKSINQWLVISSTLKETFHNRRKQLSVYGANTTTTTMRKTMKIWKQSTRHSR